MDACVDACLLVCMHVGEIVIHVKKSVHLCSFEGVCVYVSICIFAGEIGISQAYLRVCPLCVRVCVCVGVCVCVCVCVR